MVEWRLEQESKNTENNAIYQKQKARDWGRDMKLEMGCKRTKTE